MTGNQQRDGGGKTQYGDEAEKCTLDRMVYMPAKSCRTLELVLGMCTDLQT